MKKFLDKIHTPNWLTWLLAAMLLLRIPSFFEPFYYGDEMIYLALGVGIRQGIPLYSGLHDNKPPLLYLLAALAENVFWFRVILAFWCLVTIVLFWHLSKTLFPQKKSLQKVSTVIFAILTTIPLLEGNIPNAELFMIGPVIAAFNLLLSQKASIKKVFFAGLLFSFAALFKVPSMFDMGTIVLFWIILSSFKKTEIAAVIKKSAVLLAGFVLPIALTFVWYYFKGSISEYLTAAFLQNVGYLSSWRPDDVPKPFLEKNAPLLVRMFIVLAGSGMLFAFRKKLSNQFIFVTLWLLVSLFGVTLSERPYPHYLIQSVAPIALLLGIMFTQNSLEQSLVVIPLFLAFLAPVYYKFWYYPTANYYLRFVKFASGVMDKEAYFRSFSHQVPRNYQIADFLVKSSKPTDKVFVWSNDSSAIYSLARRLPPIKYVADYHVKDFSDKDDVLSQLKDKKPRFVVMTSNAPDFFELYDLLREDYMLINQIEDGEIWSLRNSSL